MMKGKLTQETELRSVGVGFAFKDMHRQVGSILPFFHRTDIRRGIQKKVTTERKSRKKTSDLHNLVNLN